MPQNCVRVGVVGAGVMGNHHARIYAQLPNVQLVGISDAAPEKAAKAVALYGGTAYRDFQTLIEEQAPDALSICVPTVLHHEVALYAAQRGLHLLIEKPLAISPIEGERIVREAQAAGICLAVGHIERFNPAVINLKRLIEIGILGKLVQIDTRRMGPHPKRIRDVGVVFDLAVHDLDLIQYLCQSEVTQICASLQRQMAHAHEDAMTANLKLASGTLCHLAANWRTPQQIRDLIVRGENGTVRVDYLAQHLQFMEDSVHLKGRSDASWLFNREYSARPFGEPIDPLKHELIAFVAAARGEMAMIATGDDGLKAIALAQAIIDAGCE